jgi:hypothetical protein
MSFAMFAAPVDNDTMNVIEENDQIHKKRMTKTLKKYPSVQSYTEDNIQKKVDFNKVNQVMKAMNNLPNQDEDNNLGDFQPLPPPMSAGVQSTILRENMSSMTSMPTDYIPPTPPIYSNQNYSNQNYSNQNYSNQNYFAETPEKDVLMDKLNYMIHLLEEQQDEKTGNVTEEVILYSFLGIFIIFIVDSFYYVGKYTR